MAVMSRDGGPLMAIDAGSVQPLASVTVNVYGLRLKVPVPLYGAGPPLAVTVTVDVVLLQVMGVALSAATSCGGCVMVMDVADVQPLASVTVNVCVPAGLLKEPVPE